MHELNCSTKIFWTFILVNYISIDQDKSLEFPVNIYCKCGVCDIYFEINGTLFNDANLMSPTTLSGAKIKAEIIYSCRI